jgi:hypothetical protein
MVKTFSEFNSIVGFSLYGKQRECIIQCGFKCQKAFVIPAIIINRGLISLKGDPHALQKAGKDRIEGI